MRLPIEVNRHSTDELENSMDDNRRRDSQEAIGGLFIARAREPALCEKLDQIGANAGMLLIALFARRKLCLLLQDAAPTAGPDAKCRKRRPRHANATG